MINTLNTFNQDTIEEMKAKVAGRANMLFSWEQISELLSLLDVPHVDSPTTTPSSVVLSTNERGERDGSVEIRSDAADAVEAAKKTGTERTGEAGSVEVVSDVHPTQPVPFPSDVLGVGGPAPEAAAKLEGRLPEGFPSRQALAGAGINTFSQLRKARDAEGGLTAVTGIGDASAAKIEEALKG